MDVWRSILRSWASERGSNVAQAAAVAILATALLGAMLLVTPSLRGAVDQSYSCLVGVLGGSGAGCSGGGAAQQAAAQAAGQANREQYDDDGGFWGSLLDGIQIGLDILGLIPGLGEIADGLNGLISLARGDYVGAALSFAAMIPFAGWAATGGKWVRTGLKYSDEIASVGKYSDEIAAVGKKVDDIPSRRGLPDGVACSAFAKVPGLAKPAAGGSCPMPNKYDRSKAGYKKPDLSDDTCTYCGKDLTTEPRKTNSIEADHLVGLKDAWQRGGKNWTAEEWKTFSNDLENLVAACKSCNASKQAKQLFDEWAPPNITPKARKELLERIEIIVKRYKLNNP